MSAPEKSPGSVTILLVGLILTTLIGAALFLPVLHCPEYCFDTGRPNSPRCPTCDGLERVSVWKQWRTKDKPELNLSPKEQGMEGRTIARILFLGFQSEQIDEGTRALGLRSGDSFTKRRMLNASYRLWKVSGFDRSEVEWGADPFEPNKIAISIRKNPSKPKGEAQSTSEEDKLSEEKK